MKMKSKLLMGRHWESDENKENIICWNDWEGVTCVWDDDEAMCMKSSPSILFLSLNFILSFLMTVKLLTASALVFDVYSSLDTLCL